MCQVICSLTWFQACTSSPQPDSKVSALNVRPEDSRAAAGSDTRLKLLLVTLSPAWLRATARPGLAALCHGPSSRNISVSSTPQLSPAPSALPACLEQGCSLESQETSSESWERSVENSRESQAPIPPATFSAPGCTGFPLSLEEIQNSSHLDSYSR